MRQLHLTLCYCIVSVSMMTSGCTITIGKANHSSSTAPMLRSVLPAVVNVFSEGVGVPCSNFLQENPEIKKQLKLGGNSSEKCMSQSQGSGVIVNVSKGHIVTNFHNVEDAVRTIITLHDRRQFVAEIVGVDPETDLALLKIDANSLSELPLTYADKKLETGDFLVAIGSPFGLDHTVTFGIVSALGRSGLGLEGYEDFIQTDAAINVGNSGGAVVSMNGKLVGISTAVVGANNSNTGIGFAITGSMVKAVVDQLAKYGSIERGQIGIVVEDIIVDGELGANIISILKNSPADKAGLKIGDIVLRHNGKPAFGAKKLHNALGLMRVGETAVLDILRKDKQFQIKAVLGARTKS